VSVGTNLESAAVTLPRFLFCATISLVSRSTTLSLSMLALVALGCSRSQGARFSGSTEPRLVKAENVRRVEGIPPGYGRIGGVTARCERVEGFQALDEQPFADLDCSFARLNAALAESAAEAGGELLVGVSCREQGRARSCSASVARPGEELLSKRTLEGERATETAPAPSAAEAARLDEPRAGASWDIVLSFEPAIATFSRPPREPVEIVRSGDLPPHHLPLGDLEARCERGACSADELSWALRVTAARFGADSLAAVRCFRSEDDEICVGTLGATPVAETGRTAHR
jgi:hypothetical protein